jgi:hypothetical protein
MNQCGAWYGFVWIKLHPLRKLLSVGCKMILDHIMRARAIQDRMWGREVDDTKNDPWRWSTYISHSAVRSMRDPHKWRREDTEDFYDAMIETAAICAAAAESVVRQRNKNGRTFYEPASGNGR